MASRPILMKRYDPSSNQTPNSRKIAAQRQWRDFRLPFAEANPLEGWNQVNRNKSPDWLGLDTADFGLWMGVAFHKSGLQGRLAELRAIEVHAVPTLWAQSVEMIKVRQPYCKSGNTSFSVRAACCRHAAMACPPLHES